MLAYISDILRVIPFELHTYNYMYFKYSFSQKIDLGRSIFLGGEGEIRTLGTFYRTPVFKTGSINHSDTSPRRGELQLEESEGQKKL